MNNLTISQVSKMCGVTPRMLRYYEKIGLLKSKHIEGYAYRVYDSEAILQLKQIILLRKLRISLKQIAVILTDQTQENALQILRENLAELNAEITSLRQIRDILQQFINRLDKSTRKKARLDLLSDLTLVQVADLLSLPKTTLKESSCLEPKELQTNQHGTAEQERKISMDDLNKAEETLNKSLNVRILLVPPYTVASYHFIGENPEETVGDVVSDFVQKSGLYKKKPDSRMFGFNHPNPGILEDDIHGYEVFVTIPDDMEVPEPLVKKKFDGGLYAVLTIPFPEFQLWNNLSQWVENSETYEPNYSELGGEIMGGCLEEHLNWVFAADNGWKEDGLPDQLDLMTPIKLKQKESVK